MEADVPILKLFLERSVCVLPIFVSWNLHFTHGVFSYSEFHFSVCYFLLIFIDSIICLLRFFLARWQWKSGFTWIRMEEYVNK
jgi:hypothetical protein